MRVITDNSSINDSGYNIATIGYFDGIHLGHKKILNELVGQAKKRNGKSILITFWPHPRNILNPNISVELLPLSSLLYSANKFKSQALPKSLATTYSRPVI